MANVDFLIDGVHYIGAEGDYIINVARKNGIYIPSLCNIPGVTPRGSCRLCTVKVGGRFTTACSTPLQGGMEIENDTKELNEFRSMILELLYSEGNHFCPSCERSGDCELQALAYRFGIASSRFPYRYPNRRVEADAPLLLKDQNRCILCKRCIRAVRDEKGRSIFAYRKRGQKVEIVIDHKLGQEMSRETALRAVKVCPVGALLERNQAFRTSPGQRKYDFVPIGQDIEKEGQSYV